MYSAEHFGHTIVFPWFRFSSMKLLHQLFQDFVKPLDDMNRATVDGKALDQLQDKLVGPFRVKDVVVRESVRPCEELDVNVLVQDEITAEEKRRIKIKSINVNLRYGSKLRIHVIVDNRRKE